MTNMALVLAMGILKRDMFVFGTNTTQSVALGIRRLLSDIVNSNFIKMVVNMKHTIFG
jgi:deoxyhypusine synthase